MSAPVISSVDTLHDAEPRNKLLSTVERRGLGKQGGLIIGLSLQTTKPNICLPRSFRFLLRLIFLFSLPPFFSKQSYCVCRCLILELIRNPVPHFLLSLSISAISDQF